ncbi:fumarylacetoacetate hydrolase family protein [Aquisalinus flavus]|nr:fumarylacetoacetate hydrolase family protein [Aquisalinus flavus]MBD0426429.1 fumarylacetoacetate hydrolase family protein [Aquisalinus flavus]UNE49273.1 fumarylacetoacetate hydrolase family protein [Aquisalinus flavus]
MRQPAVPVTGGGLFPVRRIFCVGKNYADHQAEMGDAKGTPPVFFTKPADAVCSGGDIPFPLATQDLHYEAELVVALGQGGAVYGYAAGCDLTRRDLQAAAKKTGAPWDTAKALDNGAVIGPITPLEACGDLREAAIRLSVNGERRQDGRLSQMIWPVTEIIDNLSAYFELQAGDLIYTGTPSGVGAIARGDRVTVSIDVLEPVSFTLV